MEETMFADNDYVIVLLSKKITFSLKKKTTLQKENLKVVVDGEKLTRILTKRRSQLFYRLIDVHSMTNVIGEIVP